MKLAKKFLVFAFIAGMFVISSCEKDEDNSAEIMRVENLLVSKQWNFDRGVGTDQSALSETIATVLEGSYYNFKDDGTLTWYKLGETLSGSWVLSDDAKTLTITVSSPEVWTVVNITSSSLTMAKVADPNMQYFYN